jgi:hypothetical protein
MSSAAWQVDAGMQMLLRQSVEQQSTPEEQA